MIGQSELLIDNFDNICRLCLKEESPMLSIFTTTTTSDTEDEEQSVLAAKITSIAQVEMSPDDGLPAFICQMCQCQVDKFYDFRLLVEYSDRTLRSCFDRVAQASEHGTIRIETLQVSKDARFQEYSMNGESPENETDLFSINAILVPSASGMQVWQICSAEDDPRENSSTCTELPENCTDVSPKIGHRRQIKHRSPNNLESISTRENTPKARATDEQLFYTTIINSSDQLLTSGSERSSLVRMKEEADYEEEHLFLEEYDCQLCMKSFDSLEALKKHVSDHSLGEKKREKTSLRETQAVAINEVGEDSGKTRDIESNDNREYALACHSCDELFATEEQLILHKRKNCNGKRQKYCKKEFATWSVRDCHEEKFDDTNDKKFHAPNQDSSSINDRHKCNECGKRFAKKSELRYHKGFHTNAPTTCTICNKHFRNAQTFKMHLKRHILGSRFNCVECGKSYYTNSELARHIQQHTGTREYPCHLCDMSFLSKPELNRHLKYHNGEKKFECKVCLKTYYESGHLKVHERSHTGERPFSCSVCQKGFITNSKLVRHLKIHDRARTNT